MIKRYRYLSFGALASLSILAMTDALTGLYNRRYLMEHLAQERRPL